MVLQTQAFLVAHSAGTPFHGDFICVLSKVYYFRITCSISNIIQLLAVNNPNDSAIIGACH